MQTRCPGLEGETNLPLSSLRSGGGALSAQPDSAVSRTASPLERMPDSSLSLPMPRLGEVDPLCGSPDEDRPKAASPTISRISIMSVPNVGTAGANGVWQQRRQDFDALTSAIESGNIQAAQTSLASLQKESPSQPVPSGSQDQFTNSLSQILSAVQAGNLTAAQQALGALQGTSATYGPPSAGASSTSSAGSSVQSAMQALIAAVKSGDTTAAQQALTQLQTAMKAGSGHHYHHQGGASSSASSSTTLSASTSDSMPTTGAGASAAASGGDGE